MITIIVAVAENLVIGSGGNLPWRIRSDMRHFREMTTGHPVIMGRTTFESLKKPLPDRTNIILTRRSAFKPSGVLVARDTETALSLAKQDAESRGVNEIYVIGGADVYRQMLPMADRLIVTHVNARPKGDTWFEQILNTDWSPDSRTSLVASDGDTAKGEVVIYSRKRTEQRL